MVFIEFIYFVIFYVSFDRICDKYPLISFGDFKD